VSIVTHASPSINDADLVRGLRARDDNAAADLVRVYGPRIHQLAQRYLKSREDAEEVAQDVLFKAVDRIGDFRGDAALSSWLYRITFNTAMTRLRQRRVARTAVIDDPTGSGNELATAGEIPDWSAMADEAIMRQQMRDRLTAALQRLPAIYRAPVILRDVNGLTTEEASSVLRLNGQTLKSRLHRGRLMLRRELADFAGGLTIHRAESFAGA
jgi:RNA polymerase sigma-70 factor, ECF subfamily